MIYDHFLSTSFRITNKLSFWINKMLKKEAEKHGSGTFMGRLFDLSKDNPQFTDEDIFAETSTILTGVRTFSMSFRNAL